MDNVLSNNNGIYSTFSDALINFAEACLFNDNQFGKWDFPYNMTEQEKDSFYTTPPFETAQVTDIVTPIDVDGNISNTFGIEYTKFDISVESPKYNITFDGNPNNSNEFPLFKARVCMIGSENELLPMDIELDEEQKGTVSIDGPSEEIYVVVIRLDTNGGRTNASYTVTLTCANPPIETALIMEKSARMFYNPTNGSHWTHGKGAGLLFTDLLRDTDKSGFAGFASESIGDGFDYVDFPLNTMSETNSGNLISSLWSTSIPNYTINQQTSIVSGIIKGNNILSAGELGLKKGLVMICKDYETALDVQSNNYPSLEDIDPITPEYPYYPIFLGTDYIADPDNSNDPGNKRFKMRGDLEQLADESEGFFSYSITGYNQSSKMLEIFTDISEQDIIAKFSGEFVSVTRNLYTFFVDCSMIDLNIVLVYDNPTSNHTISVTSPSNYTYMEDSEFYHSNDQVVNYGNDTIDLDGNLRRFYMENPESGIWTVDVIEGSVGDGAWDYKDAYSLYAYGYSPVSMDVSFVGNNNTDEPSRAFVNEPILVKAEIRENGVLTPGLFSSITASGQRYLGIDPYEVTLYDNGVFDDVAGDGIYAGWFYENYFMPYDNPDWILYCDDVYDFKFVAENSSGLRRELNRSKFVDRIREDQGTNAIVTDEIIIIDGEALSIPEGSTIFVGGDGSYTVNGEMNIGDNSNIIFLTCTPVTRNGSLTVTETGTLNIGNNVRFMFQGANSFVEIDGNITIGDNCYFGLFNDNSEGCATSWNGLRLNNANSDIVANGLIFEDSFITSASNSISLNNSVISDSYLSFDNSDVSITNSTLSSCSILGNNSSSTIPFNTLSLVNTTNNGNTSGHSYIVDLNDVSCGLTDVSTTNGDYKIVNGELIVSQSNFNSSSFDTENVNANISYSNFTESIFESNCLIVIPDQEEIIIDNCQFTISGTTTPNAIKVQGYPNYVITNNEINGSNFGLNIRYSGGNTRLISNNHIINCTYGLFLYQVGADILNSNVIEQNSWGINALSSSKISIIGNQSSPYQQISENDCFQTCFSHESFPIEMRYNQITSSNPNWEYVVCVGHDFGGENHDITNNFYGENFDPTIHLIPVTNTTIPFEYIPYWVPGSTGISIDQLIYNLYMVAQQNIKDGEYELAKSILKDLVAAYPKSKYAEAALKDLYWLESISQKNFTDLKSYYLSIPGERTEENVTLIKLSRYLANNCDIKLGNYYDAIYWFEGIITDPNSSLTDIMIAEIDAGYVYMLMENSRVINSGNLKQNKIPRIDRLKPRSWADYDLRVMRLVHEWSKKILTDIGGDDDNLEVPNVAQLYSNYPNPFNPITTIKFGLSEESDVILTVYNVKGQKVNNLVSEKYYKGYHTVVWNGKDDSGNNVSTGVYFYKLQVNKKNISTKKCLLLK